MIKSNEKSLNVLKLELNVLVFSVHAMRGKPFQGMRSFNIVRCIYDRCVHMTVHLNMCQIVYFVTSAQSRPLHDKGDILRTDRSRVLKHCTRHKKRLPLSTSYKRHFVWRINEN